MKISTLRRKSPAMKEFDKKEWKHHDIDHFGWDITWDGKKYYLKAHDKTKILGTMELVVEAGIGYIKTLLVNKELMRQGIGKELINEAEKITRKYNGHKMHLTTGKKWEAVKFYKSVGFEITGELKDHYFHIDFVVMSKFCKL